MFTRRVSSPVLLNKSIIRYVTDGMKLITFYGGFLGGVPDGVNPGEFLRCYSVMYY